MQSINFGGGTMKEVKEFEQEVEKDGVVRVIDELGRIVIPIETRQKYGIQEKDKLRIRIEEDKITLQKVE